MKSPERLVLQDEIQHRLIAVPQVLAAKFVCISDRTEGRDVYDIWHLGEDEQARFQRAVFRRQRTAGISMSVRMTAGNP